MCIRDSNLTSDLGGTSKTDECTNEIIRYIRKNTRKGFVIIGVGGILNCDDALEKIRAGADLLQIYTGFIYKGPSLIKNISQKIVDYENN